MTSPDLLPYPIADDTNAATWASGYQPGDTVDWRAVDIAALSSYPSVRGRLDPSGRYNGGRKARSPELPLIVLALIVGGAVVGAPLWAFATLFSELYNTVNADLNWTNRLPIAGAFFAVSLVVLAAVLVWWLLHGRRSSGFPLWYSAVTLGLGAASSFGVFANEAERRAVPTGEMWFAVVLIATGFALVSLIVIALGRSRVPEEPDEYQPLAPVARAFDKLSEREQQSIRSDLARAIDDLTARDVIDTDAAAWARRAEPGRLGLEMSQYRG